MNQDAYAHCQALVRASDRDRFVSALFAPAERRPHLFALYAFNLEVARVAEVAHAPLAGEIRLQWWHDALTNAGHGDVAGHPVASALLDTLERARLSAQPLLDLIEARRCDLYEQPMATVADFDSYVLRTSSALFLTAARIVAWDGREYGELAETAGLAYGTAALLGAVPLHASRGRINLPAELLAQHGADPADLLAGRATTAVSAVLAELAARATQHLEAFLRLAEHLPATARPALLPVATVPLMLRRLPVGARETLQPIEVAPLARIIALLRAGWFGFPLP